jgi:hypothetical protein
MFAKYPAAKAVPKAYIAVAGIFRAAADGFTAKDLNNYIIISII